MADIGIDEDFFDVGGHSLIAIRVLVAHPQGARGPLRAHYHLRHARRSRRSPPRCSRCGLGSTTSWPAHQQRSRPPRPRGSVDATPFAGPDQHHRRQAADLRRARRRRQRAVPVDARASPRGSRPVYGFQAHGTDGSDMPDPSIEAMAERYVAELTTRTRRAVHHRRLFGWRHRGVRDGPPASGTRQSASTASCSSTARSRVKPRSAGFQELRYFSATSGAHGIGRMAPYMRWRCREALKAIRPDRSTVGARRRDAGRLVRSGSSTTRTLGSSTCTTTSPPRPSGIG